MVWSECRRRLVAVCSVAALAAAAPAAAEARDGSGTGCVPGAAGIGDPYFPTYGNGGYDVHHYDLDVAYDPATQRLDGEASIFLRTTQTLCSLNLDLVGLEVERVEINGRAVPWSRSGQELTVEPRYPLRRNKRLEVEVHYGGVPQEFVIPGTDVRTGFMDTPDGATVLGQPEVAASWFPVNDHPLDKASYAFNVTVPTGYEVVANGLPRGTTTADGQTTWRWVARQAMASYLTTIDIGYWDFREWETNGIPVIDAVDSAITGPLRERIDASLGRQGEVLDLLESYFGPYPFETVGGIVDNQDDLFFALETQTRPVYSKYFWYGPEGGVNGDAVVVHELAHQWFGDDLALARWQDIWLNEGFATYAEWLWSEHEGLATPQEIFDNIYTTPADNPDFGDAFWDVRIGNPGVDSMFDLAVYYRGAMTLHALRNEVGEADFRAIVRTWARSRAGQNVTTEQFIAHAESVSGQQLDELFDAWLFTAGRPELPAAAGGEAEAGALQARRSGTVEVPGLGRRPHAHP
jgi:aminopeptidase N